MEEASPVKPSVAELAGKLKSHVIPTPKNEAKKSGRSPPCCLPLHNQEDGESEKEKPAVVSPHPPKVKMKNSPLIEKLQANLALGPTALLPSTKSPETKTQATPFCPISPCSPLSPTLRPPQQQSEDEVPVSFEQPAEGTPLPNINKSRVRLSFKRRPPTRQHRKSAGEEVLTDEGSTSPCEPHSPDRNGDVGEVLSAPREETKEDLEDSTHPTSDTDKQEGHDGDVIQDNGASEVSQEGKKGEVSGGEKSGKPQASDPMEIQVEETQIEEQNPEKMEGVEEHGKLQPNKGKDELKDTSEASGD